MRIIQRQYKDASIVLFYFFLRSCLAACAFFRVSVNREFVRGEDDVYYRNEETAAVRQPILLCVCAEDSSAQACIIHCAREVQRFPPLRSQLVGMCRDVCNGFGWSTTGAAWGHVECARIRSTDGSEFRPIALLSALFHCFVLRSRCDLKSRAISQQFCVRVCARELRFFSSHGHEICTPFLSLSPNTNTP